MRNSEDMEFELKDYDDTEFYCTYDNDLDIMKVQRIDPTFIGECFNLEDDKTKIRAIETLYERKEILTEEEKEYLQEIINIFSEKVYSIERDDDSNIIFYFSSSLARQPMDLYKLKYKYKKMEENHKYTLEELGI